MNAGVLTISMDPKHNSTEATDLSKLPDNFLLKNQEFYLDCLGELQGRLKFLEIRLSMISVVLKSRGLAELEAADSAKMAELVGRNRELNEEDFAINYDEKNNTELLRLLEDSFEEKLKTFRSKKLFIDHIRQIREDYQGRLSRLFDQLNAVEDEYIVTEKTINALQEGILQNNQEVASLNAKAKVALTDKESLDKEQKAVFEEVEMLRNKLGKLEEEIGELRAKTDDKRKQVTRKLQDYEQLQSSYLNEQFAYYEAKEKSDYIDELYERVSKDLEALQRIKGGFIRGKVDRGGSQAEAAQRHRANKEPRGSRAPARRDGFANHRGQRGCEGLPLQAQR